MKSVISYILPSLSRLNRTKEPFEKYLIWFFAITFVVNSALQIFLFQKIYSTGLWVALCKTVAIYFSYLIMIELSPDSKTLHPIALIITTVITVSLPDNVVMSGTLFFLMNIRILTKSSGYLTTRPELLGMSIFTGIEFVFSPFIYPLLFGVVLLMDYKFKHKDNRNIPFALLSLALSLLWVKNAFGIVERELDLISVITIFVVTVAYALRLSILKTILSFNDTKTNIISPKRIKSSGVILLVSLIVMAVGHAMFYEFVHLWVTLICISFPYLKDIVK